MENKSQHHTTIARILRYLRREDKTDSTERLLEATKTRDMLQEMQAHPEAQQQFQNDLAEVRQRWHQQQKSSTPSNWSWVAVAAGIALLLFAGLSYYQSEAHHRLYAEQLAQTNDDYLQVRGTSNENPEFQSALDAYQAKRYEHSLIQFQALREANPFDAQILLYTALSAMQLGQDGTAQQALDQLLSLEVSLAERTDAHWYTALLHLKQERFIAARENLQWIIDNVDGARKAQAEQLLSELTE